MKFYLVQNSSSFATFTAGVQFNFERFRNIYYRSNDIPTDILPVVEKPSELRKCALLKELLEKENSAHIGRPKALSPTEFWSTDVYMEVPNVQEVERGFFNGSLWVECAYSGGCLGKLAKLFEGVKVQVDLSVLKNGEDGGGPEISTVSTPEMDLEYGNEQTSFPDAVSPETLRTIRNNRVDRSVIYARVTITVTIPEDIFNLRCGHSVAPLTRKILNDEVLSDVTILCGDGMQVKAHRNFLAARSSVFLAMFESDMKEARESTVEIPDMEERSVRAFLKYLYYGDIQDAEEDFQVALELFKAGHKYDVSCLEEKMRELILNNPNNQIDVEEALKLFLFARNLIPPDEELKEKAMQVMERYSDVLDNSVLVQEVFRTDHKAGMELFKYAFKCQPSL